MLKLVVLTALILPALAAPPLTRARVAKQATSGVGAVEQSLIAEEKRVVWESVVKKDLKVLEESFAEEFTDVSDVGVFTKAETIKLIPSLTIKDYSLDKFKVILPGPDTAVVTYEAIQHWTIGGREEPSHVRASSVWVRRGGRWQVVFHQESTLNDAASVSGGAATSGGSELVGDWEGESVCGAGFPACHDEHVVYHVAKPDEHGNVSVAADKIVNGKPVPMGVIELKYDAARQTLTGEMKNNRYWGIWEFRVEGDTLEGTLTILPDKTVARRIKVKKAARSSAEKVALDSAEKSV
jgi:hypothetical protein